MLTRFPCSDDGVRIVPPDATLHLFTIPEGIYTVEDIAHMWAAQLAPPLHPEGLVASLTYGECVVGVDLAQPGTERTVFVEHGGDAPSSLPGFLCEVCLDNFPL